MDKQSKRILQPHTKPASHLLRRGRFSEINRPYLLTTVTHGRNPVFKDIQAARVLINVLRGQHEAGSVNSLAFVIMPDHLHWLVQLRQVRGLRHLMQIVKGRSARAINSAQGTPGRQLWQKGYHDHALRLDEEVKKLARYIVANPLRAGLVKRIEDYPHWDAIWL